VIERATSDELLLDLEKIDRSARPPSRHAISSEAISSTLAPPRESTATARFRSASPPPVSTQEAVNRAIALSKKLSSSNIRSRVTDSGDLVLDMEGYKSSEDDALRAELIARKVLAEELKGNYDIGALIGADERGNLWIYSSEEAKDAAARKGRLQNTQEILLDDAVSDPGHQSDDERSISSVEASTSLQQQQQPSARPNVGLVTPPKTPPDSALTDSTVNYAKTLRLTSDQLKALKLKPGANSISFSVNKAVCQAHMFYWTYNVPVVVSDIDGTITK
jgi:phosphatidate phosphatase LPIN